MNRTVDRWLPAGFLIGVTCFGLMISSPGCESSSGNPPAGSISSPKKGADAAPAPTAKAKAKDTASRGRIGGDR